MNTTTFAIIFTFATIISVLFQLALAAGMPWGHLAMGGRFPGKFPPNLRVGALVQGALLAFFAFVVLSRAEVAFPTLRSLSNSLIWAVVVVSGFSLIMNMITQSKKERALWAPIAFLMTICSLVIALG